MGMTFVMIGLTPEQIEMLAEEPAAITDLVAVATHDEAAARFAEEIAALQPEARERLATELREGRTDFAMNQRRWADENDERRRALTRFGPIEKPLSLGKLWHILHYALAGDEGPTGGGGDALLSGEEIGPNAGYGPARLLTPAETAFFSRHLDHLDAQDIEDNLDFQAMGEASIYLASSRHRDAQHDAGLRRDAGRYFVRLQDYVTRMADKGNGLLMWIH